MAGAPAINVGQRFGQTLQNLRNVDVINQQRDIAPIQLEQAQRQAELEVAQQPALLQQAEFAASGGTQLSNQQQQAQQIATSYATALRPLLNNPQALVTELQRQKVQFQNAGVDTSGIDEDIVQAQTPEGLALLGQEIASALTSGKRQFASKASAPIADPTTGQLSTPVFDPNTNTTSLIPIQGAVQQTATQEAEQEFKSAKKLSELSVAETKAKETAKSRVARTSTLKKEFSERRRLAARSNRKVKEAQKLAQQATQGVSGQGKLALSRLFPGIDASDEGALSSAFKSLALDELQKFKGPTTDFEFAVTEDIAGSLGSSSSANLARLSSLDRANWFMDRESKQFNDHIKGGHDPDEFFFNFNELVTPKKGGKSYSLQSLQDTAVANHISIDEVIKRLSR